MANGTTTVDIVAPNGKGISHNKFREYNVDASGIILNNSTASGLSVLGGSVSANSNLTGGGRAAAVILNEVTGTASSLLAGPTEVFGSRADVIVANPNGVGCVGCTFINVGNVVLSGSAVTDTPAGEKVLQGATGDVVVSGGGISAPSGQFLNNVTLAGRSIRLDGKVNASGHVSIAAGETSVDARTGVVSQQLVSSVGPSTGFGIQSTSNGVISAGTIGVLSADIGVNVTLAGSIQALADNSAGNLSIRSAGSVFLSSAEASGDASLDADDAIELKRDLIVAGRIVVTAKDVRLLSSSGVTAGKALSIVTRDTVSAVGMIKSGQSADIHADKTVELAGMIVAHDDLNVSGARLSLDTGTLSGANIHLSAQAVELSNAWLSSTEKTYVTGNDVLLDEGTAFSTNLAVVDAKSTLKIGTLIDSRIYPALTLAYQNLEITRTGTLASDVLDLDVQGTLVNEGLLFGLDSANIKSSSLLNGSSGTVRSDGAVRLDISTGFENLGSVLSPAALEVVTQGTVRNQGTLQSAGSLSLNTADDVINSGTVSAGNGLSLKTSGLVSNAGSISSTNTLTLEAQSYLGSSAATIISAKVAAIIDGDLRNHGLIAASDDMTLIVGGLMENGAAGTVTASALQTAIEGDMVNLGQIVSTTSLKIVTSGLATNKGLIQGGTSLSLDAAEGVVNSGSQATIAAGDKLTLSASDLANEGGRIVAQDVVDLQLSGNATNKGLIYAANQGLVSAAGLDNQAGGQIEGGSLSITLPGGWTNSGTVSTSDGLTATIGGQFRNQGSLVVGGVLTLTSASLVTGGSSRLLAQNIDAIIDGTVSNAGAFEAVDALSLRAVGGLSNAAGASINGKQVALDIRSAFLNVGQLLSSGTLDVIVTGLLANASTIAAMGDLSLQATTIENTGEQARISSGSDLQLVVDGNLTNALGQILATRNGRLNVGGLLSNLSGRIESGADLDLAASSVRNDAAADSRTEVTRIETLGAATLSFFLNRPSSQDYFSIQTAVRDEFSGDVVTKQAGVIRSGSDLSITTNALTNQQGRILSAGNMSVRASTVYNDAVQYTLNHYRNSWGSSQEWLQPFYTPTDIGWSTHSYSAAAFRDPGLLAAAQGGDITIVIAKGNAPVSKTYSGREKYRERLDQAAKLNIYSYTDAASLLDLAALGIDPNNVPDVIVIGTRFTTLGGTRYDFQGKTLVGQTTASLGSVIKASGALELNAASVTNLGTISGDTVAIEAGTLQNGQPLVSAVDGSQLGGPAGQALGNVRPVAMTVDDVVVPPLSFNAQPSLPNVSVNRADFGTLERLTGSHEAATLLGSVSVLGQNLSIFADPEAEARAFSDAMAKTTGGALVITGKTPDEIRTELYSNALAFASASGAQYGTTLTEAQRAALEKPLVWHETRIVDGRQVLVPVLYLPPKDELLRGPRGPGLIQGNDLVVEVQGTLANTGAMIARDFASISARDIVNERLADLAALERGDTDFGGTYGGVLGRSDSGLISAGSLYLQTDANFANRGGKLASAGDLSIRVGGDFTNETLKVARLVDKLDGCEGKACGTLRTDWSVAEIAAGGDLTLVADGTLTNWGGSIGAVGDAVLAAADGIHMQTLQDSFLLKDVKARGFLSGSHVVEHAILTQEAQAKSLTGNLSILAGYSLCADGKLCAAGDGTANAVLNGAVISAYEDVTLAAQGDVTLGAVSTSVDNKNKQWGFAGLSWSKVRQEWNSVDTRVTRIAGENVAINAGGDITGVGSKIAAANDLLILADGTVSFKAAQDQRYFTEKGFSIGLTFPGSAGIDAALKGGSGQEVLTGLASINPFTATLARLSQSENGLGAALASAYVTVGGLNGLKGGPGALGALIDPTSPFRDASGALTGQSVLSSIGINISNWKTEQRWSESAQAQLSAGNDLVLKAGLDVVLAGGTQLVARGDALVKAERDVILAALADYADTKARSFSLSIKPLALEVGVSASRQNGETTRYSNAAIVAGGTVDVTAGRDLMLAGGNIEGKIAEIMVGRDLTIASLQDTNIYREKTFGASISLTPAGIGGSLTAGKTTGDYANVAQQSGISAGSGGFDITVGGKVDLIGGAIVSEAPADKNALSAREITFRDLENTSKAQTGGFGVSLTPGGIASPIVSQPATTSESGAVRSTISPATLSLSGQSQDLASLNRDPALANTQVGAFDIEALQQKQRDAAIISQALNLAVGDISQVAGFAEGSPEKVALHAVAGAAIAAVSGGDIALGALSAAAQEKIGAIINAELEKNAALSDAERAVLGKWAAVAVGAAIGGAQGAAIALDAQTYNYLTHEQLKKAQAANRRLRDCIQESGCSSDELAAASIEVARYQKLSQENTQALIGACSSDAMTESCRSQITDLVNFVEEVDDAFSLPENDGAPPYIFAAGA
uniref:two-partner secretion domain-containing protein n=1 Tax=uncultured Rhizobium sp. TaxID=155567 RepID=UPI002615962B